MRPADTRSDPPQAYHLEAVAAAASAEVLARLVDRAQSLGRSGLIADLAACAQDAALSPLAEDAIRASAYAAGSDDLIWGRALLAAWRPLEDRGPAPTDAQRRAWAAALPTQTEDLRRAARDAVARFEADSLRADGSAFEGAQHLPGRLDQAIALQKLLWDDPRIVVTPKTRVLMRETLDALRARREGLNTVLAWPRRAEATPVAQKKPSLLRFFKRRKRTAV